MKLHDIKILAAARAYLNLKQEEIAKKAGLTNKTISNLESGKSDGGARTIRRLREAYEDLGIVFTPHGFEYQPYKTAILENFIDVLIDAESTLKKGDEILMFCADERRNTPEVTKKFKELRNKGVKLRMICEQGNNEITGDKKDYRWVDPELFAAGQVEVIYSDKYLFHFQDEGKNFFVVTKNKGKTKAAKAEFEYHWKRGFKSWEEDQTI